ncbi:hypothetical protein JTE90_018313 [Oedothorax gibbosus]|uniref:Prokineticin domain-containing protein n=1 Tax=Oedothorax gibbosus TaxID=931172 RepID=A0AAV6UDE9_9ARAC|nr:hypothetical protein JTE90_018313 [Oedothorax gibbosus]
MNNLLICLLIGTLLIIPAYSMSCRTEPERCDENSCCLEFGIFGRCRPFLKEGEKCELTPTTSRVNKHVYMMLCPCGNGLKCEEDDSGSIITGRCVQE